MWGEAAQWPSSTIVNLLAVKLKMRRKKNEQVKATAIMISTLREHNTEKTKRYVNYILYMHNVSRGEGCFFFVKRWENKYKNDRRGGSSLCELIWCVTAGGLRYTRLGLPLKRKYRKWTCTSPCWVCLHIQVQSLKGYINQTSWLMSLRLSVVANYLQNIVGSCRRRWR